MFDLLLLNLRSQGLTVGMGEWLAFLDGVRRELVVDVDGLYTFGRAVLCQSESQFDAWDLAFQATYEGVELPPVLKDALLQWVGDASPWDGERSGVQMSDEELLDEFRKRLAEQKERHDGGSRWVGTGGTSPFGSGGKADRGVRVGKGGGRSAIEVAGERRWAGYRTDRILEVRDYQVALRALRNLAREGDWELDLEGTIDRTCSNGGDIDLHFQRERENRVHLVLMMDTGGSMDPYVQLVERLFTAASKLKGFKSFSSWYFHNVPYGWLYRDYASYDREPMDRVLSDLTPQHRVIWVGDACMAPWELFSEYRAGGWSNRGGGMSGLDWVQLVTARCPASVWLNPEPVRFWDHPTITAIGAAVRMFPLTLAGLTDGVKALRSAR